jgi:N-acetylmuramoyl-L-alanine amidase
MIEQKLKNRLYKVQVGAFANKANADKLCNELKAKGYSAFVKTE